jgi:signal transduction histidine kinase/CheY-like chemotaxis protein
MKTPPRPDPERQLRLLIDNLPDTVVYQLTTTPEGGRRFTYVSRGVERLNEVAAEDALADPMAIYGQVLPEYRALVQAAEAEALRTMGMLKVEVQSRLPSGRLRWFRYTSTPRRRQDGLLVWDGIEEDVTERKLAEAARLESRARARSIIEKTPIGMHFYELTADGRLIFSGGNPAADKLLGIDHSGLVGKAIEEAFPGLKGTDIPAQYRAVAAGGPAWHSEQIEYHEGAIRGCFTVDAFRSNPAQLTVAFTDVTARRQAEAEREDLLKRETAARAEAEAANRAKDDFLAIVSHELRTPLTAILGWSWLLRTGDLSEQERARALEVIGRCMKVQKHIIDDLIDLSSFSRGRLSVETRSLELRGLLESVCESISQDAAHRGITLVRDLPESAAVMGDPGRLQQVFWNLLHNSMKFTGDGGEIGVRLRCEDGRVRVEVFDSGQGIPPDFLPYVFEPFRQGEPALTRQHRGLGLGLAIVKQIIELHGGTVTARSAGENRGAVFIVDLPAAPAPEPGRTSPEADGGFPRQELSGLRILVVEDDPDGRALLSELLRRCGARIETASGAGEAMACLEKSVPDLLLCDLAMPDEDGFSLMRRVRARGGTLAELPAMALTALTRKEDRARALQAGFHDFATKPVHPPELLAKVLALTGRRGSGTAP